MSLLISRENAPTLLYLCPNCTELYIGKGFSLQVCPHCDKDALRSVQTAYYRKMLNKEDTYCIACHRIPKLLADDHSCLPHCPDHNMQPLPQEILSWLSEDHSKPVSNQVSNVLDSAKQSSLSLPTNQVTSTTPSTTPANTTPSCSTIQPCKSDSSSPHQAEN